MNVPPDKTAARWPGLAAALLIAAVLLAGAWQWRQRAQLAAWRAALPAAPAVASNPTLQELLARARREADAGNVAALAEFGRLCHANGYSVEAEACWTLLARRQPREGRWHYYLADLRRTAGDQAGAESELEATVAADPGAAAAWLQLAEMKFKTGRAAAARADYERRLALLPGDPYAELGLARIDQMQGHTDETVARLERILQAQPKFSAAQNLYAELQSAAGNEEKADWHRWLGREAGRFREAEDPWMDELNASCRDPLRLCHLGTVAYQAGRGDRGRARFELAITLAPHDPLAYQLLGELTLEEGDPAKAHELLQRGLDLATAGQPTPTHYLKLHAALTALQREADARRCLQDALARHPTAAELHYALGQQLARDGNWEQALAAHQRARTLSPALVDADFAIALLQLEHGNVDAARAALAQALRTQPTYPKALLLLGRMALDAGQAEAAGEYLLPLLKANPGVPEIREIVARWRWQAGVRLEKSDPAGAERHYRAGLALRPEDPRLNAGLGALLVLAGRIPESVGPLELAWRGQPEDTDSALFLAQAYARTGRPDDARRVLHAALAVAERTGKRSTAQNIREILAMLGE